MSNVLGIDELIKDLEKLNREQAKELQSIIKSAVSPILTKTRAAAPVLTGALRKGIVLKNERSSKQGKKVIQVTFDSGMNDVFQKKGKGKQAYYPASQEYGFIKRGGGRVAGKYFMKQSIDENYGKTANEIEEKLMDIFDKTIGSGG